MITPFSIKNRDMFTIPKQPTDVIYKLGKLNIAKQQTGIRLFNFIENCAIYVFILLLIRRKCGRYRPDKHDMRSDYCRDIICMNMKYILKKSYLLSRVLQGCGRSCHSRCT